MMVTWGVWVWDQPGSYFSIPWSNYLGWLLVSGVITILIRPGKLPLTPLLIIYTSVWLLKSSGLGLFWGIHGAAIVGGIFMGIITILAWRELIRRD
jgi:putative membrane protein